MSTTQILGGKAHAQTVDTRPSFLDKRPGFEAIHVLALLNMIIILRMND